MDDDSGLCVGCQRTLDEIACWGGMDNDQRRDVLAAVQARRAAAPAPAPASMAAAQPGLPAPDTSGRPSR